jgi:hypothetical protein
MQERRLTKVFCGLALLLGGVHSWLGRHSMSIDGVSYLDVGDAYFAGDWHNAVNAYWSPFYSWIVGLVLHLVKPSPYGEFATVQALNYVIYALTLAACHFFLSQLLLLHRARSEQIAAKELIGLPAWSLVVIVYTSFIWTSIYLVTTTSVSPDMLVAAVVYVASGLILRIMQEQKTFAPFFSLGIVLGLGYLVKAPLFLMAFIFLGIVTFSLDDFKREFPKLLTAAAVFLLFAVPFMMALYHFNGRVIFGDSAKLNYAWFANGVPKYVHWQGETPGTGIAVHPTRKIAGPPTFYEFSLPIGGTYPPWYNPSYWHEGLYLRFDFRKQIRVLASSIMVYTDLFFESQAGLVAIFIFLYIHGRRHQGWMKDISSEWRLLIPAISAFAMFAIVHVEPRFIAAFIVLFWTAMACGVRMPNTVEAQRILCTASVSILITMLVTIGTATTHSLEARVKGFFDDSSTPFHVHWQIASSLKSIGLQSGDKVVIIGDSFSAHWARLAKVKIVAEILPDEIYTFWAATPLSKTKLFDRLIEENVSAVVANYVPPLASAEGWKKLGPIGHHVYVLSRKNTT